MDELQDSVDESIRNTLPFEPCAELRRETDHEKPADADAIVEPADDEEFDIYEAEPAPDVEIEEEFEL
jgi:hypothetical protein